MILIQRQIGWFHPQSKRFCYTDEKEFMQDHFKGYTVAVVTADALEQAQGTETEGWRYAKELEIRIEQLDAALKVIVRFPFPEAEVKKTAQKALATLPKACGIEFYDPDGNINCEVDGERVAGVRCVTIGLDRHGNYCLMILTDPTLAAHIASDTRPDAPRLAVVGSGELKPNSDVIGGAGD